MSTEYRRIKNRRDTSAGWIEKNPVLLEGELGLETDTRKIKFGDGVNYWIDLPYSGVDSQEITDIVTSISYTKNEVDQIVNTVEGSIPTDTSDLTNGAGYITINDVPAQQQADWTEANSTVGSFIKNKPNLATVATSGDYDDLTNKPTIPTDTSDLTNGAGFITLNDVPAQQQADWTEVNTTVGSYIKNKPNLATVATSGSYNDLTDKPTIPTNTSDLNNDSGFITINDVPAQQQANWTETNTTLGSYIQNKPNLATVATSGSYTDLSNTPTIPTDTSDLTNNAGFITINDVPAQQQANWTETNTTLGSYIQNKPNLATVATSGDYTDLTNKPTIPTVNDATVTFTQGGVTKGSVTLNQGTDATIALDAGGGTQVNADWNESDPTDPSYIENKPTLATVATSGSYTDLTNTPTIPAAQVNSDWNSDSGKSEIYNKPRMGVETLTFTLSDQSTVSIDVWVRTPNYFYVEDISGSANTLSIVKDNASAPTIEVFKSTDMVNWTSMGTTSTTAITTTVPANGKVYLKATANQWGTGSYYNKISASGNHNVGGNIMSLLVGDNYEGGLLDTNYKFQFYQMFLNNNKLINASKLELPNNVTRGCYHKMFKDCINLLNVFTTLPATTLANNCYDSMFQNCNSLLNAPALPATTLTQNCYLNMFYRCFALTTAPTLPATTTDTNCYQQMFAYCSSLNKIIVYLDRIVGGAISNWTNGVSATGDFYNLGSATYSSGASGIPSGWTVHTSL